MLKLLQIIVTDHRYNLIYKLKVSKLFIFAISFSNSRQIIPYSRSVYKSRKIGYLQGLELLNNSLDAMF
jgi:hypothetical protein